MQTTDVDIRSGKVLELIDKEIRAASDELVTRCFDSFEKYLRAFGKRESLVSLRYEFEQYAEKLQTEED